MSVKRSLTKFQDFLRILASQNEKLIQKIENYLKNNFVIILVLIAIAVASYGFELFNFNLTIDEEIHSFEFGGENLWNIKIGRWGKYFLEKFLFSFPIIPFVPLFLGLTFHIMAILLFLRCFGVKDILNQISISAIGISCPVMVFIYMFSISNYQIGIGLFFVVLSLYIYIRVRKPAYKFLAIIPAIFALSIYETFFPALIALYLLFLISNWTRSGFKPIREIRNLVIIIISAVVLEFAIQIFLRKIMGVPESPYVDSHFYLRFFFENAGFVLSRLSTRILQIYSGDIEIYGISIVLLGIFLLLLGAAIVYQTLRLRIKISEKLVVLFLLFGFLIAPFALGIINRGLIPLRSLVSLPLVLMGWVMLGLKNQKILFKSLIFILSILCTFYFISSSNHLFASSHLALQQDRLLAGQIITRIEEEKSLHNVEEINYLDIIGYVDRPSTPLVPKIEVIGSSFFGWDQGNAERVAAFLQTLGFNKIQPLPIEDRASQVPEVLSMPNWPDEGSVMIIDDVAIVKFGPYSNRQTSSICLSGYQTETLKEIGFCP